MRRPACGARLLRSFGQGGTKAAPCRFTAQGAKLGAGPLVETPTRRLYHDEGEAKLQTQTCKSSLGMGRSRGFSGDDGRCIGKCTGNDCTVTGQRTASYSGRGGNLRRQSGDLSSLRQGESHAWPRHKSCPWRRLRLWRMWSRRRGRRMRSCRFWRRVRSCRGRRLRGWRPLRRRRLCRWWPLCCRSLRLQGRLRLRRSIFRRRLPGLRRLHRNLLAVGPLPGLVGLRLLLS